MSLPADDIATLKPPAYPAVLSEFARLAVLLVEAGAPADSQIETILSRAGLRQITRVQTGTEALKHCRGKVRTDLILFDMVLPDMDGFQLADELAAVCDAPQILMLTPNTAWRNDVGRVTTAAADADILFRPVRELELVPRVRRALALRREMLRQPALTSARTDAEKRCRILESRLQYLAGHDPLTGLYNRGRLEEALETALIDARAGISDSVLLHVDIDRFKLIREYAGYAAGDRLLRDVADALRAIGGDAVLAARTNGDEFGMLLRDISLDQAAAKAEQLRQAIARISFTSNGNAYTVHASIGLTPMAAGGDTPFAGYEDVMGQAQLANYVAKRRGGNLVHRYFADDAELVDHQQVAQWTPRIRQALREGRFRLVFQPVLHIADMTIDHFEVLVRMVNDDGELLSPALFIPVAERMGLIHEIDRWVIAEAIKALQKTAETFPRVAFNINLSGRAFRDELLLPSIKHSLEKTGIDAGKITFEITETAAIDNFEQTREMVTQLHELGCRFALDDFGAGFASYSYLKEFPFDFLKIDGAFIVNLAKDSTDQVLVKSMVDIAHTLGKQTTAEFVGDPETLALLNSYGVDHAQGFFIGRPAPTLNRELPTTLLKAPRTH